MRKIPLIGQLIIVMAFLGCGRVEGPALRGRQALDLESLTRRVAGPPQYPARSGPVFFNRENLHEAIDGMAPEYISYGCEALGMLEWRKADDAEEKFQAEVYDMGSPLGAFGIYSRAHTGDGEFCDIGEEAAVAEDSIEFSRGRFFVKLMGPMDSQPVLKKMARAIASEAPPGPRPQHFTRSLPREGRIPRTERWMPEGAFGMEFLRRVWIARYRAGEKELELFLAPFENEEAVRAAQAKFREAVKKHSPKSVEGAHPGFVYSDEWIGVVGVFQVGRKLAVVVGHETRAATESLLRRVALCQEAED